MKLFHKLRWYFLQEWKKYLGSTILLIFIAILQLIPPKIVGVLIDSIIIKKKYENKLFYWIILIFLISFVIYILRYIWRILLFSAAYKLAIILRVKIYHALSTKNTNFYLQYRTGDLMARSTNDIDKIVFAAGEGVLTLVDAIITSSSVLTMMIVYISWKLTIISLIPMPIMTIILTQHGKKLYNIFQQAQQTFSNLNNHIQESIKNIYMIKNFGLEKYIMKKFKQINKDNTIKNVKVSKIDAKFDPIIYYTITFSNMLAICSGSYFIWNNYLSIGTLTSFIMYLGLMTWPMLAFAWMFNIMERGHAAWNRIQEIIKKDLTIQNSKSFLLLSNNKKLKIQIKEFKYPNTITPVLYNIFINIKFNEVIGLCGPTGSGKSTLLNLIQRNFDISKGDILYNNISIKKINLFHWRKKITYVNQNIFLFSDTISNNIAFGNINATQKNIENVAKLSNIHHDILQFPHGYQTKFGRNGIMLSGGQKQRIAIARALLMKSEILILDNVLSAMDILTQHQILKNILSWGKNKHTIILVTHELHIMKKLNNILIIQKGKITDHGKHNQLIKYNNWYSQLYQQQKKIIKI
ncbi:ABC transporter transmembrane domain-containing protein [Buchnera aphidicola]|uniref:Multidrug resistance-like ATP-binding protein MdlA n=1 Tax=Buchnera aphidicola (Sarucallis kahawaluokalani) TaxID=1241878 RepID=A0A4D6Y843_9GAMM|nr:ABC transporter transmembrane domain-containing protein [Buchnera aphidicola]QCI26096.1 ATP-binding cassette domain-containing protein [Buchnera aphidicola (Sarucallis kahawaluokalani)]